MKRLVMALGLVLVLMLFANVASAAYILDFGVVPYSAGPPAVLNGGSISYALGGPLVGTGIVIDDVSALGMPVHNGVYPVNNGVLKFGTGGLIDYSSVSTPGGLVKTWIFGGGPDSYIEVKGGVTGIVADGSQLMWGQFNTATVVAVGNTIFKATIAGYSDQKNQQLAAYFGIGELADHTWDGNMVLQFIGPESPDHTFSSEQITSGNVSNAIPEPASLLLLGSGLVGLAGYVRRKRSA